MLLYWIYCETELPEDSQDFIVAGVCHLDAISILLNTLSKTLGGDFQKKIDRKYHYYFIFLKPSLSYTTAIKLNLPPSLHTLLHTASKHYKPRTLFNTFIFSLWQNKSGNKFNCVFIHSWRQSQHLSLYSSLVQHSLLTQAWSFSLENSYESDALRAREEDQAVQTCFIFLFKML